MNRWVDAAAALALAVLTGCTSPGPVAPLPVEVAAGDRPYLLPVDLGLPAGADPAALSRLAAAARGLLERGDATAARQAATTTLAAEPGSAPAFLLLAQVEVVEGRLDLARGRLAPLVEARPDYLAASALLARVEDGLGNLVRAVVAYRSVDELATGLAIEPLAQLARGRAAELRPRAREVLAARIVEATGAGRIAEAERALDLLRSWDPPAAQRLPAELTVARAKGDQVAELAAVRALAQLQPESRRPPDDEQTLRWAELELAVGDPGEGLKLLQDLDQRRPGDPRTVELLARARFLWRLQLLPREVRELANRPELTRGELAALLYWLVSDVRRSHAAAARIASDVLDHPHRDAIVRVVNLGLMDVDETMHRFAPERPVRRLTALTALLRLLAGQPQGRTCLGLAPFPGSLETSCAAAAHCGLVPSEAECLPGAGVSGAEAVGWIERALEIIGGE